ncbi:hypothetical protein RHMOL_Rhmol03G0020300 [Rhododendron molle]|uniref:Uncharacterized protein n=1 Tax=Rhododendron molle TaxID=49168 RepID=A0ACC0P9E0_RHOML|nr:hypothetical protein RHMOL_Rhmol03G0020300 [Rhododendron molle]
MGYESLFPISFTKLCLCYDNHRAASRNHRNHTPTPLQTSQIYMSSRILDLLGTLRSLLELSFSFIWASKGRNILDSE